MPRLFTAIEIPDTIRRDFMQLIPARAEGVTPSPPGNLHITLHFIGEVPEAVCDSLRSQLCSVATVSFHLRLSSVDCFHIDERPRFLWAGVDKTPELVALRDAVGRISAGLGLPLEDRDYSPHVTLARLDSAAPDNVDSFLQQHAAFQCAFEVTQFALYCVDRLDGASTYRQLQVYDLDVSQS